MAKVGLSIWNVAIIALIAIVAVKVGPSLPIVGDLLSMLGVA